jgi:hypothetical protein
LNNPGQPGADLGREAVYAAERMAFEGTELEVVVPFAELERQARRVLDHQWWSFGAVEILAARSSTRSSSARRVDAACRVTISATQSTSATLIHELAHVVAGPDAGHGPAFRRAHTDLARLAFGAERSAWLIEAYQAAGLEIGDRPYAVPPDGRGPIAL